MFRKKKFRNEPSLENPSDESRTEASASTASTLGLQSVYEPENVAGELVFLHGLGGSSLGTWTWNRDASLFWPRWLPEEDEIFANFRISTFGFNAKFRAASSNLDIIDFAKDLLLQLFTMFGAEPNSHPSPIIFVVHSLGGLVVKKAFTLGNDDQHYAELARRFRGIIFLGTPHRGSQYAKILNNVLAAAPLGPSPKAYVAALAMQSPVIQDINESFEQQCEGLLLCSFYETLKTNLGFRKVFIVEKESAILGYPNEISAAMHADHQVICKYQDRQDANFLKLKGVLKMWALQLIPESILLAQHNVEHQIQTILGVGSARIEDDDSTGSGDISPTPPGRWLFNAKDFQRWISNEQSESYSKHFCLVGLPGTGKSVLARSTVEHLRSLGHDVQCHFFDRTQQAERTVGFCLRSLASQLALSDTSFREALFQFHERTSLSFDEQNQKFQTIWDRVFQDILFSLPRTKPIVWVLDGIDKSDNPSLLFTSMSTLKPHIPIKIMFTSTPLNLIPTTSQANLTTRFFNETDTLEDMREYVSRTVQRTLPDDGMVQELVMQMAAGSFLWAKLALEMVRDQWHTIANMEVALSEVPNGMAAMYRRMLAGIQEQTPRNHELARSVITWVVCSWRPPFVDEIADALQSEFGTFTNLEATISQICGHFITIDRSSDTPRPRAGFIHTTARSFLIQEQDDSEPWVEVEQTHEKMAIICLAYLCEERWERLFAKFAASHLGGHNPSNERQKTNRLHTAFKSYPLLEYATCYWAYHVSKSPTRSPKLMKALESFMLNHCLSWIEAVALTGNMAHLARSARYLEAYVKRDTGPSSTVGIPRATPPGSPIAPTLSWIKPWATDFIRIAVKFAPALLASPSSVHRNLPPMCPGQSMISTTFSSSVRPGALSVQGLSSLVWDDLLASTGGTNPNHKANQVLATESYFFTLMSFPGYVTVWSAETCENLHTLYHNKYLSMMAVNKVGTLVVASSLEEICIWDNSSGILLHKMAKGSHGRVQDMKFGDNDTELAVAYETCALQYINAQSGEVKRTLRVDSKSVDAGYQGCPSKQTISQDLTRVAMAWPGRTPLVWDLQTPSPRLIRCRARRSTDSLLYPKSLAWHPDTGVLLVLSQNSSLVIWRLADDELTDFPHIKADDMAVSKDGRLLLTNETSGKLCIRTFPQLHLVYSLSEIDSLIKGLTFSPDSQRFYDIRGSICNVWEPEALGRFYDPDMDSASVTDSRGMTEATEGSMASNNSLITSIAVSPRDRHFACGRESGAVTIHNALSGQRERIVYTHPSANDIVMLCWSPSGRFLLSCDENTLVVVKRLQFKDDGKWAVFASLELRFGEPVQQILFNAGEKMLLISSSTKDRVWNLNTRKEVYSLEKDTSQLNRWILIPRYPSKRWLISASNDAVSYEWATGQESKRQLINDGASDSGPKDLNFGLGPLKVEGNPETLRSRGPLSSSDYLDIVWSSPINDGHHQIIALSTSNRPYQLESRGTFRLQVVAIKTKEPRFHSPSAQDTRRTLPSKLSTLVRVLLGTRENSLIFLAVDSWIYSYDLSAYFISSQLFEPYIQQPLGQHPPGDDEILGLRRHFYLPKDMVNSATAKATTLNGQGTLFCPKLEEVAIIRNGLRF